MGSNQLFDDLIAPKDLAVKLGIEPKTLQDMKSKKEFTEGVHYFKLKRSIIMYSKKALLEMMCINTLNS